LEFTHHILEKNQLIENYTQEINSLKNQEQTDSPIKSDAIQELKSQTILTNDDWMKFKELFENIYPKFFPYLKSNYPDLTQAEVRFLAFTKLEITPKEMASLLGVSDEAIRTLRFRLKKKLGLSHGKEIEQVVMSI
jgi:DNA-binding CsgD family transcriptional regulator